MGWQERDWARWTDEERARFYGASPPPRVAATRAPSGVALAVIVSLAITVIAGVLHLRGWLAPAGLPRPVAINRPSVIYGTGTAHVGGNLVTCTELVVGEPDLRRACTAWSIVLAGQRPAEARPTVRPPGCATIVVDQRNGRWVCSHELTS